MFHHVVARTIAAVLLASACISGKGGLAQTPLPEAAHCTASDYAPDSIAIRTGPATNARIVKYIPQNSAGTLVNTDAVGTRRGDWLKVGGGATGWASGADLSCHLTPAIAQQALAVRASRAMALLKAADFSGVSHFVHPAKGVRLSPYGTIDTTADIVVSATDLPRLSGSSTRRRWGTDDGSGKPLNLSFRQYYRRFIYSRDFKSAPEVTYNAPEAVVRNIRDAYPNAVVVSYRFAEAGNLPATSLGLVFERHRGTWYLVGIVHDGWTI